MPSSLAPIDDYTLAAFLAGNLSDADRARVIDALAADPEGSERLAMAAQALEAAQAFVEAMPRSTIRAADRAPRRSPDRHALQGVKAVRRGKA